jgi:ABC-type multidrug transport system, ATPase component
MKNKIQLLCCLIRKPKIILLDEPLSSFDIIVSHDIKEQLLRMKSEHIILMSTHIMQLAQDVSDEIVLLHDAKLKGADNSKLKDEGFENYIIECLKEE